MVIFHCQDKKNTGAYPADLGPFQSGYDVFLMLNLNPTQPRLSLVDEPQMTRKWCQVASPFQPSESNHHFGVQKAPSAMTSRDPSCLLGDQFGWIVPPPTAILP